MKIIYVAVFGPNSTNVSQGRAFKNNKHDVLEYDYRAKLGELGSVSRRDDNLIETIKKWKPDITIFSKCNNLHYRVVDEANKIGKTVLWYMDPMNNFNAELIDKIKRVTLSIAGLENVQPAMAKYNPNSIFLNQCPDEEYNKPIDIDYKYDVTFIGAIDGGVHADRTKYLNKVGFKHFNGVYGHMHNKIVNQSKINLNFSPTDKTGASVRLYKLLAAKSFVMTTPWINMEKTFIPDQDIVIFNDVDELKEKISYYLDHPEERDRIRENGHKTVQNYMPNNWANKIIENL